MAAHHVHGVGNSVLHAILAILLFILEYKLMPFLIIAMTALKLLKLKSLISRSSSILALLAKL